MLAKPISAEAAAEAAPLPIRAASEAAADRRPDPMPKPTPHAAEAADHKGAEIDVAAAHAQCVSRQRMART